MATPADHDRSDSERTAAARRDLARIAREGETLGGSAMHHAAGTTPPDDDAIERLGKKIGRGLAIAALPVALYVFGRAAGWW